MRTNSLPVWVVAAIHFVVAVALARSASARACSTDTDCPLGFQCTAGQSADVRAVRVCLVDGWRTGRMVTVAMGSPSS
jgi:hypothetical protein